ncbi:MAG: isocitrate/isopropylmalate family dehydrogenase [Chloroflexi bacterium]|nr:isocitrate/isopropylmalate family dehydrogenase [Chloroflexota bacterium]
MEQHRICILQGDETGQELLDEALRVLDPGLIGMSNLVFETFDLSLENRRRTNNDVVREAAARILETGLAIKAATITPGDPDDVGSPNALLRDLIHGSVILRTGRRIPSVRPLAGVHAPIAVARMAVEGAYAAKEWREGQGLDEIAYNKRYITRRTCRAVAEFTFQYARRIGATVFGGPKYTVSPIYEGLFKEELDRAAQIYRGVRYHPQLIDATYALLLETSGEALVIPALNRDGDNLSDLVMKMFGTIAGAESIVFAFGDDFDVKTVVTEAPHGTAPSLQGKNIANPMAMILACGALLRYIDGKKASDASRAIYESTLESVYNGIKTTDLGGRASTSEFVDEVIREIRGKLDVWDALGSERAI